jgi:signal transduction histidine kinase
MASRIKQLTQPLANGVQASAMRTTVTLLTAVAASGGAALLIESDHIGRVEIVLVSAVLFVGILFGLLYGVIAFAAALAFRALTGASLFAISLQSDDALLLMVFGVGVAVVGLFINSARRSSLMSNAARQGPSAAAAAPGLQPEARIGSDATSVGARFLRSVQRAASIAGVIAAGVSAGWLAGRYFGDVSQLPIMLSAVTACGALFGAPIGLASGVIMLLAMQMLGGAHALPLFSLAMAMQIAVFAGVGWGVGRLGDELRRQSDRLKGLVNATRDLSLGADEAVIREILLDRLSKIANLSHAELRDESGEIKGARGSVKGTPASGPAAAWRTRRLVADGRDVGEARWLPEADGDSAVVDSLACSLVDLGAAAIVRSRLSAEKAEMEFITRTEHLRTILLDAVSHHFRSPLAGIIGSVTSVLSLPEQHDRDVRRELLLIIKEQANRLNRYVDNFLSVARLESGSIDVKPQLISLEALVYDVWESFGEAGGARRFLRVTLDEKPVRADEALMTQILGNLLENAIKFSSEGSVIDVIGKWQDDELRIEVIDEGCGVPETSLGRMFDRFYRSPGAKSPGLGRGQYITRSLAEMLGGRVEGRNRVDGQSGFVVTLHLPIQEGSS